LRSFHQSLERPGAGYWTSLCFWICMATLTRQLYAWLAVGAALALIVRREPLRTAALKVTGLLLACLPLGILIAIWGGLTPPTFQHDHVATSLITPRSGVFGLSVFGLYWLALFPDGFVDCVRRLREQRYLPLVGILFFTVVIFLAIPTAPQHDDDGILWRLSRVTPELAGTPIGFWLLAPVGLLFFWNTARSRDRLSAGTMCMALAFLICNLPNAKIFEKYYDPMIIAFLIFIEARFQQSFKLSRISRPLLMLAFGFYPVVSWRYFGH